MPVFLSASRFLRVTFPPEQFGMGSGVEEFFDKQGNALKKKLPHRPAKFEGGQLVETKEPRVEMLRKHPGNKANGGDAFWEQSQADTAGISALHGKPVAHMPDGGLTAEDLADFRYLAKAVKHLAPAALDNTRARVAKVHERFRILGVAVPPAEFNISRLKGRIVEVLGVLEDNGIWNGNDAEQKPGNPGRGKAADG